jgi:broad specificity phosphatase PhoE
VTPVCLRTLQAREIGDRLAREPVSVDVVVVSPFLRCIQTAQEVIVAYEAAIARVSG